MLESYIPIFIIIAISILFAIVNIKFSSLFGPQRPNKEKMSTYESGMVPIGTARDRVSIKYYMVAVSFIVFDIEVVFLYPWAVSFLNFKGAEMLYAFTVGFVFIVILTIGLIYEYKKGVLNWD